MSAEGRLAARTWECGLLFVAFPVLLFFVRQGIHGWVIPILVVTSGICLALLWRDPGFARRRLGRNGSEPLDLDRHVPLLVGGTLALVILLWIFAPERIFQFPRERPGTWALVLVLYPLLSVYPQELVFRAFFFHRYREVMPEAGIRIAASAAVFGLAHLVFGNWIAPVLTAFGGWVFARDYARHGSVLRVSLVHALWGDLLFTIGYGHWFFSGSIT